MKRARAAAVPTLIALAALAAGCSKSREATVRLPPCDAVTYTTTMFSQTAARHFAEAGVLRQADELKSEILRAGYRNIRIVEKSVACRPFFAAAHSGLTECTATARLCGR